MSSGSAPETTPASLPSDIIGWPVPKVIRAIHRPKRTGDLRNSELSDKVGQTSSWRYSGTSSDDEPYPGQRRWVSEDPAWGFWWVQDEDLELVP